FHNDCFLEDIAAGRNRFCSPLLVNSVFAVGCSIDHKPQNPAKFWFPNNPGYWFFAKAKKSWEWQTSRRRLPDLRATLVLNVMYVIGIWRVY
ncbi:hypothetical protein CC78DRAFT_480502, partial [Lojkania enalia]